jgi:uncharacterized protein YlaI
MKRPITRPGGRSIGLFLAMAVAGLLVAASTRAQDPPHWQGALTGIDCTSQCHTGHHALGGGLTASAANVNLCQSCHRPGGDAGDLAINNADKAGPGQVGVSHAFDVCSANAATGAQKPTDKEMSLRVMGADGDCADGYVVCSTCHNQHSSDPTMGGSSRISPAKQLTALGSTGDAISGGTFTGSDGFWYLIEIVTAGDETAAKFAYSKDNGISWIDNGPNPCTPTDTANCFDLASAPWSLGDGVTVDFTAGGYADDEQWEFNAAWRFLRAKLDDAGAGSVMCRDCHGDWDMQVVDTWNSGSVKSHPVRRAYPSPGTEGYYDTGPLEGDGRTTGSDGNDSNDLDFDGNSQVQCLTCHAIHFVDSNTQTADGP